MYVVTFYSFKGGVGRTQALMETAAQIALSDKKVLVVDFDLEAPGLGSVLSAKPKKGVVDFILDYLKEKKVPDAKKYISKCKLNAENKKITVDLMSAGLASRTYGDHLEEINWRDLYAQSDGFLLMEDLREQWAAAGYEYVLLDSRTGHVDSGGICTRQMPNALVAVAFPNKQNMDGLKAMVSLARDSGGHASNEGNLPVHLVLARIPTCDDEKGILDERIKKFQSQIDFETDHRIFHYDSMDLLDGVIFSLKRQQTKLAKSYEALADAIRSRNDADRDGVLLRLEEIRPEGAERWKVGQTGKQEAETRWVESLLNLYKSDAEILFFAGTHLLQCRMYRKALEFLSVSNDLDEYKRASLPISFCFMAMGRMQEAAEEVLRCFEFEQSVSTIESGLLVLSNARCSIPANFAKLTAFKALNHEEWMELKLSLALTPDFLEIRRALLQVLKSDEQYSYEAGSKMVVALLSSQLPKMAIELARSFHDDELDYVFNFNYCMSDWAYNGKPDKHSFAKILIENVKEIESPNRAQCGGLLAWLNGDFEEAKRQISLSKKLVEQERSFSNFSCWSYSRLSAQDFIADLDEMQTALNVGEQPLPRIVRDCVDRRN